MQTYQNQQGMNQQPAPMGLSDQELAYDLLYQEKALTMKVYPVLSDLKTRHS